MSEVNEQEAIRTHPARLTGAEIVWATLEGEGVREVFGYPGGAILPVYDALRKFPIRHILVRHEQGGTHMADGYARASGKVGVMLATSGPGATNLVTGLATAMLDSIPIVCITGQVSSKFLGTDAFQEVDITGITLPITKHNYLVTRAEEIAPAIREAFLIARSGRPGPVLVDITKDAQQATADFDFEAAVPGEQRTHPMLRVESDAITNAVELILNAKRPMIFAGHGVLESRATDQVRTLAERLQIPVTTTLLGLGGFPASHELNLGMMGMHGESWVNESIQHADLLIACGMRFDDRVTGRWQPMRPRRRRSTLRLIRRRSTRTLLWMSRSLEIFVKCWSNCFLASRRGNIRRAARSGCARSMLSRATLRFATSRTFPTTATSTRHTSSTTSGARLAAKRSSSLTLASTRCGRRSTTSMTSRARSSRPAASGQWVLRCLRRLALRSRVPKKRSG